LSPLRPRKLKNILMGIDAGPGIKLIPNFWFRERDSPIDAP
jgi:hypothetical protein